MITGQQALTPKSAWCTWLSYPVVVDTTVSICSQWSALTKRCTSDTV